MIDPREIAFWVVRGPARLHPPRLSGAAVGARPGSSRDLSPTLAPRAAAERLADRRGPRRGGRDRGQGPRGARARLPAGPASGDRGVGRLRRSNRRARAGGVAPTSCSTCRAGARWPPSTRRWSDPRGRSSPSPTPTASGSVTPSAAWSRRLGDPAVGYVCGQVRFDGAGAANEEGLYWRYEMAVRELRVEPRRA